MDRVSQERNGVRKVESHWVSVSLILLAWTWYDARAVILSVSLERMYTQASIRSKGS